ncbi:bicyclomycin resistance protein [Mollisia scopiformis]|uniref:Bicyclomycin resistance protein n=1 Tax=Mollisia scopiformis TaxID=149040 RepID=A0A194XF74_MOLSC|nr:bicyclomycin resistance protein [Mollisia scopiformis]KUJ18818.1 bicyclomycin resistance protein [Mollisia scopiformis]
MAAPDDPTTTIVDEDTKGGHHNRRSSHSEHEVTDHEKVLLAAYEGHDADIPSNEGYILDEQGEFKRKQSIAASHRRASLGHNKRDVEKTKAQVSAEDSDEANIVWWDGDDDPQNPLNFSKWLKVLNITIVSAICFVTPLGSSMFAPGVPQLMTEFRSDNIELASFVVSVYVLGFAVGPLFFAPLSELYGRMPVYHLCNLGFLSFTIACALATNLNMLIGFRFLAGVFGSAPLTNGGGTIADLVTQEKRGKAMSGFVMGPIIGPIIGPVAGGYLSQAKGWRWTFWVLAMLSGTFGLLGLAFMRETYAYAILDRKTKRLRKETGNMELRSKLDSGLSAKDYFLHSIVRPTKMLFYSPIVLGTAVFVGVVYGYLYLLFTTFTPVFEETYHFSSGTVGLTFLGLGIGSLAGVGFFAWATDHVLKMRRAAEEATASGEASEGHAGALLPEFRLKLLLPAYCLIPCGLFIYGWTAKYHVHWIVPILATVLIGIGNMAVFMCISLYLIDAFSIYAASALAANTVIRSIMGAVLPLAGQQMYKTLGLGWGNSLLAFVALGILPVPWAFLRWGERLRTRFEIKNL